MNLFNFEAIKDWIPYLVKGTSITLSVAFVAALFGLLLGVLLNVMQGVRGLRRISVFYIDVFRGTPVLLQLSFIYYALPRLLDQSVNGFFNTTFDFRLSAFTAAVLTFSLNSGAYLSEVIRSGVNSVDSGEVEAAKALGIKKSIIYKDIILPTALRHAFPALMNELITLVKESSIVSLIGLHDLMRRQQIVTSQTYLYFEPLLLVGLVYYITIKTLAFLGTRLERRMNYAHR